MKPYKINLKQLSTSLKQKLKYNILNQNPLKKNHREFIDILYFLEENFNFDSNDFETSSSLWKYINNKILNSLTDEKFITELENKIIKL